MTAYPIPASVAQNIERRAAAEHHAQPCGAGTGGGQTCGHTEASLFPCGWRCQTHRPGGDRG